MLCPRHIKYAVDAVSLEEGRPNRVPYRLFEQGVNGCVQSEFPVLGKFSSNWRKIIKAKLPSVTFAVSGY
jgi:hypothetical protein